VAISTLAAHRVIFVVLALLQANLRKAATHVSRCYNRYRDKVFIVDIKVTDIQFKVSMKS
jgi:hypothetical protein